jgi:uracil-DNA glycosylase
VGPKPQRPAQINRSLARSLETLQRAGITHLPRPKVRQPPPSPPIPDPSPKAPAGIETAGSPAETRVAALAAVARKVTKCRKCEELACRRTQTVFGSGNPNARVVFMGEAPGADEDRQGLPFVGRAGQLLTDIIVKGMGIPRDEVYILNTIKCRPPENRAPTPEEAANCREFLEQQLDILRPEFICCLGAVAAQNLLGTTVSIGQLRGKIHDFRGIKVVCTYHPAYLLRTPAAKRQTWDDIQMLMKEMGLAADKK